jgi:hypothetical protein
MSFRLAARAMLVVVTPVILFLAAPPLTADPVAVRHLEGRVHGFLVVRDMDNAIRASGNLVQLANGNRVTSELRLVFKDGSLHQETAVFTQHRVFQLIRYRLVQKGSAFKRPTDLALNTSTGEVAIRYTDEHGRVKTINERMDLPADLANGMVPTLLADVDPAAPKTTLSMLVSTPKPRLVKLEISPQGEDLFSVAGSGGKALRYVVKVDIGGIAGILTPIAGKQPPDTHIWMSAGKAPGFLRSEGPLSEGGPLWRIELASPAWPKGQAEQKRD